jgi:hypothetical protein
MARAARYSWKVRCQKDSRLPPDHDPGIELLLVEETLGALDGVTGRGPGHRSPLAGAPPEFRREGLGGQAAGKLDLSALGVVLHVKGELLQEG